MSSSCSPGLCPDPHLPAPHMVVRHPTVGSARSLKIQLTTLLFFRGGAPPGAPGPCRGPGASWDRVEREDEPAPLDMFSRAAREGLLGSCRCALCLCLLGRLHAARQADFQDLRCALHPDLVCHQLELSVLPAVLRRARVQVHREAVCEAEIQVGTLRPLVTRLGLFPHVWGCRADPQPMLAGSGKDQG